MACFGIPLFEGEEPLKWIEQVEAVWFENDLTDADLIKLAFPCFVGKAKAWIDSNMNLILEENWCSLMYSILLEFQEEKKDESLGNKMEEIHLVVPSLNKTCEVVAVEDNTSVSTCSSDNSASNLVEEGTADTLAGSSAMERRLDIISSKVSHMKGNASLDYLVEPMSNMVEDLNHAYYVDTLNLLDRKHVNDNGVSEFFLVPCKIRHKIIYLKIGCSWTRLCSNCLEATESSARLFQHPHYDGTVGVVIDTGQQSAEDEVVKLSSTQTIILPKYFRSLLDKVLQLVCVLNMIREGVAPAAVVPWDTIVKTAIDYEPDAYIGYYIIVDVKLSLVNSVPSEIHSSTLDANLVGLAAVKVVLNVQRIRGPWKSLDKMGTLGSKVEKGKHVHVSIGYYVSAARHLTFSWEPGPFISATPTHQYKDLKAVVDVAATCVDLLIVLPSAVIIICSVLRCLGGNASVATTKSYNVNAGVVSTVQQPALVIAQNEICVRGVWVHKVLASRLVAPPKVLFVHIVTKTKWNANHLLNYEWFLHFMSVFKRGTKVRLSDKMYYNAFRTNFRAVSSSIYEGGPSMLKTGSYYVSSRENDVGSISVYFNGLTTAAGGHNKIFFSASDFPLASVNEDEQAIEEVTLSIIKEHSVFPPDSWRELFVSLRQVGCYRLMCASWMIHSEKRISTRVYILYRVVSAFIHEINFFLLHTNVGHAAVGTLIPNSVRCTTDHNVCVEILHSDVYHILICSEQYTSGGIPFVFDPGIVCTMLSRVTACFEVSVSHNIQDRHFHSENRVKLVIADDCSVSSFGHAFTGNLFCTSMISDSARSRLYLLTFHAMVVSQTLMVVHSFFAQYDASVLVKNVSHIPCVSHFLHAVQWNFACNGDAISTEVRFSWQISRRDWITHSSCIGVDVITCIMGSLSILKVMVDVYRKLLVAFQEVVSVIFTFRTTRIQPLVSHGRSFALVFFSLSTGSLHRYSGIGYKTVLDLLVALVLLDFLHVAHIWFVKVSSLRFHNGVWDIVATTGDENSLATPIRRDQVQGINLHQLHEALSCQQCRDLTDHEVPQQRCEMMCIVDPPTEGICSIVIISGDGKLINTLFHFTHTSIKSSLQLQVLLQHASKPVIIINFYVNSARLVNYAVGTVLRVTMPNCYFLKYLPGNWLYVSVQLWHITRSATMANLETIEIHRVQQKSICKGDVGLSARHTLWFLCLITRDFTPKEPLQYLSGHMQKNTCTELVIRPPFFYGEQDPTVEINRVAEWFLSCHYMPCLTRDRQGCRILLGTLTRDMLLVLFLWYSAWRKRCTIHYDNLDNYSTWQPESTVHKHFWRPLKLQVAHGESMQTQQEVSRLAGQLYDQGFSESDGYRVLWTIRFFPTSNIILAAHHHDTGCVLVNAISQDRSEIYEGSLLTMIGFPALGYLLSGFPSYHGSVPSSINQVLLPTRVTKAAYGPDMETYKSQMPSAELKIRGSGLLHGNMKLRSFQIISSPPEKSLHFTSVMPRAPLKLTRPAHEHSDVRQLPVQHVLPQQQSPHLITLLTQQTSQMHRDRSTNSQTPSRSSTVRLLLLPKTTASHQLEDKLLLKRGVLSDY